MEFYLKLLPNLYASFHHSEEYKVINENIIKTNITIIINYFQMTSFIQINNISPTK